MGVVRGCEFPDGLRYHVDGNVWLRAEPDGTVSLGMTSYACTLAGAIEHFVPKRVGKVVRRGKSCATIESRDWVGPAPTPLAGEIVAVNTDAVERPGLIGEDPYGRGWLVRLRPEDGELEAAALVDGADALARFEARMEAEHFDGC